VGFRSEDSAGLTKTLEEKGIEVFTIGSAQTPGKIFDATQSGFWAATEI
jgi:hypothetical protein